MSQAYIMNVLEDEEGFVAVVYDDATGKPIAPGTPLQGFATIGHGILVDERRGGGITEAESQFLMGNRVTLARNELTDRITFWSDLPMDCQDALILMAYQMGVNGVMGFRKMLGALRLGDREAAADEALDSKWARQTSARAQRVAALIRGEETV